MQPMKLNHEKKSLNKPITGKEIESVIIVLWKNKNKSSGQDNFTSEVY